MCLKVQVQIQQSGQSGSQQIQRQQVLSATPAQLSQVKAFVSQAQLQASLNRTNSPVGAATHTKGGTAVAGAGVSQSNVSTGSVTQAATIQLQNAQQVVRG